MSSKRLDTIADYTRHGFKLRIDCRSCKRLVIIDPRRIVLLCQERNWSKQMPAVEARMRCSRCKGRDVRLGPAFGGD